MFYIEDRTVEKHDLEAWRLIKIGIFHALYHTLKGKGKSNPVRAGATKK